MKAHFAIFEDYEIRRVYDEITETWLFSVIDVLQALTQQTDYQAARKYWNKLKERLKKEGSQSVTNCHRLKLAGGGIAKKARIELENKTGKKVVTGDNYLENNLIVNALAGEG
jgi:hypothetical protein